MSDGLDVVVAGCCNRGRVAIDPYVYRLYWYLEA